MTRALATIGTGPMRPVLAQALRTFLPYAERHHYEVRIGNGESAGRPPAWGKVPFIEHLLEQYDEVLWLDADVAILDADEDLGDHVKPDSYQALVETRFVTTCWVNTGVWFLRAEERTARFLRAVWDSTEYINHPWWENTAVKMLLGYQLDSRGLPRRTEWSDGTQILPEEWNMQVPTRGLRAAKIRHYSAQSNDRRERWIRTDADRISGRPPSIVAASKRWVELKLPRSRSDLSTKVRRRARMVFRRLSQHAR